MKIIISSYLYFNLLIAFNGGNVHAENLNSATSGQLFLQNGVGAVPRDITKKLKESGSVTDFGADPTGVADSTAAFQKAIAAYSSVFIPAGKYMIDPSQGIVVRTGLNLWGDGKNKTVLFAKPGGCTTAQLASYRGCAIIRRNFSMAPAKNSYVNDVRLADFAVVMTHPLKSVTSTEIQIGIDMRNITRSIVERVHVGNIAPVGGPYVKSINGNYEIQGYGIVLGNVSSGASSYAGGEVNTIRDCSIWGAYKLVVIDDKILSPQSAAHATTVVNSDLQTGQHILVQESRYTTGISWRDNTLQDVRKQFGNTGPSYVLRADGYGNEFSGGYIEAGSGADYLLYLGNASRSNNFRLSAYTATNAAAITDLGSKNRIRLFENGGSIPGGVDSSGADMVLYNKALKSPWVKFHWDGSSIVIDGGQGATASRTSIGTYTITWTRTMPSDNYSLSVVLDTNASGHGGIVSIGSSTASSIKLYTYALNAGSSTIIDPRHVWVRAEQ